MYETIGQIRNKREKRKRKYPLWLIAIVIMTVAVTGTFAYMSIISAPILNTISFGTVSVDIEEPGIDPGTVQWGENTKPVQLKNTGGSNAAKIVVRAMLVPVIVEKDGTVKSGGFAAMSEPVNNVMALGDVALHFDSSWSSNWFFKDGLFYYRSVLAPGQSTAKLLSGVTKADSGGYYLSRYDFQIKVLADALQAEGGAAQDAWGIQVDTATGVVTP